MKRLVAIWFSRTERASILRMSQYGEHNLPAHSAGFVALVILFL